MIEPTERFLPAGDDDALQNNGRLFVAYLQSLVAMSGLPELSANDVARAKTGGESLRASLEILLPFELDLAAADHESSRPIRRPIRLRFLAQWLVPAIMVFAVLMFL